MDDEIDLKKKLEELKRENTSLRNEVYRLQEELRNRDKTDRQRQIFEIVNAARKRRGEKLF